MGLSETIRMHEDILQTLDAKSGEFTRVSSALTDLYKVENDREKIEIERMKAHNDEDRVDIERAKATVETLKNESEEKKTLVEVGRIVTDTFKWGVGLGVNVLLIGSILKFEETGCIRTKAFNMLPKFKWF